MEQSAMKELMQRSPIEFARQMQGEFVTKKVILVVAGNYHQYLMYLRKTGLTREDALYVCRPRHIAGLGKKHVKNIVYPGESWKNPLFGSDRLRLLKAELGAV